MYTIEFCGAVIKCETPGEVLAILPGGWKYLPSETTTIRKASTLAEAIAAESAKPARKKPGPKPRAKKADDDVLTPELKAKLAAEVPLICRKPHGCGKPFESKNRMAWYCPACTARRDEGRAV